jgi:hypothetical protein
MGAIISESMGGLPRIQHAGPSPRDAAPHGADPVLCEAAQITANPVAFSLGCAVNKDGTLVQESADPIVA